ncbi:hypothetical protein TUA1478L_17170 [Lactiplantibacillus plantarum]
MTQQLVANLKTTVPRQLYPTPVQARVEGKVIARVDVPPLRKNAAVNGEQHSTSKKRPYYDGKALINAARPKIRLSCHKVFLMQF